MSGLYTYITWLQRWRGPSLRLSWKNGLCPHMWAPGRTSVSSSSGDFARKAQQTLGMEDQEQDKLDLETKALTSVSSSDFVVSGLDFSNIIHLVWYVSVICMFSNLLSLSLFYNMDFSFSVISERSFFVRYHGLSSTSFYGIPNIFDTWSRSLINSPQLKKNIFCKNHVIINYFLDLFFNWKTTEKETSP